MADQPHDKGPADGSARAGAVQGGEGTDDRTVAVGSGDDRTVAVAPGDDRTVAVGAGDDRTVVMGAAEDEATIVRPRPRGRPRLLMRDTSGRTQEIPLVQPEVTIGRATSSDVVIANPEVSRAHAKIAERGDAHVLVEVGTRRNTRVNGELVTGERVLQHGDVIELASEKLVYAEREETPSFGDAAPAAPPGRGLAVGLGAGLLAVVGFAVYMLTRPAPPPPAPPPPAVVPAPPPEAAVPPRAPAPPAEEHGARPPEPAKAPDAAREVEETRARESERAERVRKLTYQADIAFLEQRFTTPPDGSAFFLYNEVLKLEPDNERARRQIGAIIARYLEWGEAAVAQRDRRKARQMADKVSYLHTQAPSVGDAADIERRLAAIQAVAGP